MDYWPDCSIFVCLSCLLAKPWMINVFAHVKCLEQSLAQGKHYANWTIFMIICYSPLKCPSFPVFLRRNYIYFCCLLSPCCWTFLPFLSPLLCLENSYSSFKTNLRYFLLQKIFFNWHTQPFPWAPLAACMHLSVTAFRILWGITCLLVCLQKGLLSQRLKLDPLCLQCLTDCLLHSGCPVLGWLK